MKLYEYQGKHLFRQYGIDTPAGVVIHDADELPDKLQAVTFPAMIKAQALTGGRGKAGGVKCVMTASDAENFSRQLLGDDLKGCTIDAILVEECVSFVAEYYLSITLDSASRMPVIIFSTHGGIDIEEVAVKNPDQIVKVIIDPLMGLKDFHFERLFRQAGLADPDEQKKIKMVITALYAMYDEYDCLLVEINPLMKLSDGRIVAADAKVDIDDSGLFRHSDLLAWRETMLGDLERQAKALRFLYIDVDPTGTVGVISNGSGMIMTCVDWISRQGGQVTCALDLSGGATADRVAEGIRILSQNPSVKALLISIFGGITRCDEIAGGILKAVETYDIGVPIVAKLDGTNKEKGMQLLAEAKRDDVIIADNVQAAAEKVLKAQSLYKNVRGAVL